MFGSNIDKLPYNTFRVEIDMEDGNDSHDLVKMKMLSKINYV